MSHPTYAKLKKPLKSMMSTFLKTNFSKNEKNVTKYITYPKISFLHQAECVLRLRKENVIQNRWTQNLLNPSKSFLVFFRRLFDGVLYYFEYFLSSYNFFDFRLTPEVLENRQKRIFQNQLSTNFD